MSGTTKAMVMGSDDVGAVVVDCGSWEFRAGTAGDDTPRVVVPAVAGVKKVEKKVQPQGTDVAMLSETVGAAALIAGSAIIGAPLSYTDVSSVYEYDSTTGAAHVRDWDAMAACWSSALRALRIDPTESPFLMVEPSRAWSNKARARALECAIETVGAPAAYLARGAAMAAFAHARTTSCVVDIGHQGAVAVPVVEGYTLQKASQSLPIGGRALSERLASWTDKRIAAKPKPSTDGGGDTVMSPAPGDADASTTSAPTTSTPTADGGMHIQHLRAPLELARQDEGMTDLSTTERFASLTAAHRTFHRMRVVHNMKCALLRVDPDLPGGVEPEEAGALPISQSVRDALGRPTDYVLPDGHKLDCKEVPSFADALFENEDSRPLSKLAYDAATAADADVRRELYAGVVFTGGCALIPGALERFSRELAVLTPQQYKLKVLGASAPIERTAAPWIGGSIVASLGTFQNSWVSKAEYDEEGAANALRRCP